MPLPLLHGSRVALLAAGLLVPAAHVASIDFGPVQLGGAASHMLRLSALEATASGAGFSATRTPGECWSCSSRTKSMSRRPARSR